MAWWRCSESRRLAGKTSHEPGPLGPGSDADSTEQPSSATALRNISRDGSADPFTIISLKEILEPVSEIWGERILRQKVRFVADRRYDEVLIEAKLIPVMQILTNLLSNALDAVSEGGDNDPWIRIVTELEESRIRFAVVDSRPGIRPESKDKIFTPFFTTKDPGRGAGLGLPLCRMLTDQHRGRLFFDDSSQFTRVVLELPRQQDSSRRSVKDSLDEPAAENLVHLLRNTR